MKRLLIRMLVIVGVVCVIPEIVNAQKTKKGIFDLSGYTLTDAGPLQRVEKESFQGMAIYKDYLVSLNNTGWATLYQLQKDGTYTKQHTFKLGSWSKNNHANVANFGVEFYEKGDAMPLLYVSQTKTDKEQNLTDACFVERIHPNGRAELVQTIVLDKHDEYYGNAVQWAIDKKRKLLVGFGNTKHNRDPKNHFRIMTFKLPKLKQGQKVILTEKDILENYLIQDYDTTFPHIQIGQGGVVAGHCLVMPTGLGSGGFDSVIYSWDLKKHRIVNAINMQQEVPFEFEDCDFFQDKLYIQCNKGKGGQMLIMNW